MLAPASVCWLVALASGLRIVQRPSNSGKVATCTALGLVPANITNANYADAVRVATGVTVLVGAWYGDAYSVECLAMANGAFSVLPSCGTTPVLCDDPPGYGVSPATVTLGPFVTATATIGPLSTASATRTTTEVDRATETITERHAITYPPLPPGSVITANRRYAVIAELSTYWESENVCWQYGLRWAFVDDVDASGLEAFGEYIPLHVQPRFPTAHEAYIGTFVCPAAGEACTPFAILAVTSPWFPSIYAVCQSVDPNGNRVLTAIHRPSGYLPADVDAACAAAVHGSTGVFPASPAGAPIVDMPLNVFEGQAAWVKTATPAAPHCAIYLATSTWRSIQFFYDNAQCAGTVPPVCVLPADYPN